jgi:hypothetical protein
MLARLKKAYDQVWWQHERDLELATGPQKRAKILHAKDVDSAAYVAAVEDEKRRFTAEPHEKWPEPPDFVVAAVDRVADYLL